MTVMIWLIPQSHISVVKREPSVNYGGKCQLHNFTTKLHKCNNRTENGFKHTEWMNNVFMVSKM